MSKLQIGALSITPQPPQEPKLRGIWHENLFRGAKNRLFQIIARIAPSHKFRAMLHRGRGVRIGKKVWIGYDAILETSYPWLITIEDGVSIGIRTTIVAHFRECKGVKIERDAFVGPGVLILPNVIIGHGAVVQAGSVVTRSVPPLTVVQGNPATPVAKCGIALKLGVSVKDFSRHLKPIGAPKRYSTKKLAP